MGTAAPALSILDTGANLVDSRAEFSAALVAVDVGLVLAVDCSSSVDAGDFKLQMGGIASALRDPAVYEAITGGPQRQIALALVQWSTSQQQLISFPWQILATQQDLQAAAQLIEKIERQSLPGGTGLAAAVDYCNALLLTLPAIAERRVIDVSGDGEDNDGGNAIAARNRALVSGITINGLPIVYDSGLLLAYYQDEVIGGPGAFTEPASNMITFRDAMLRKLLREIGGPVS